MTECVNGSSKYFPTDNLYTIEMNGRVKIRTDIDDSVPVMTVPDKFSQTVEKYGTNQALSWKNATGSWEHMNYNEYYNKIRTCAKAFLELGLERHHAVCILGFNSPEWFISNLAAIFAGGVSAGIYTTNSPEACLHCCLHSKANIVVVEDEKQLEKILEVKNRLPDLKALVQYSGTPTHENVLSWDDLMKLGDKQSDSNLDETLEAIYANECCTLVFTSGTVGNPKAVMLSHDNFNYDTAILAKTLKLEVNDGDVLLSYLPLSHVAAQIIDIHIVSHVAGHIYFADKNALKGTLVNYLQEVQPTRLVAVPRVWEKIHEKMLEVGASSGFVKKMIATWAKQQGLQHNLSRMNGQISNGWGYTLASNLVFKRIKQALGLNRVRHFFTAAAPLSSEVKKYFMSLDILILEAFGMSEVSGAHTVVLNDHYSIDSIGRTLAGVKTKIDRPDSDGQGEICMAGRNIFMGYVGEMEKTKETIDNEHWLHSGDIGKVDENGFIYVTGRIKELLITAGGENIPPIQIETLIKNELAQISNAFLIGDKRKFLCVLLSLKSEVNPETGAPLDKLTPATIDWLKSLGCNETTVSEVVKSQPPKLFEAIQKGLDIVNKQAISNAQKVQKFALLPSDFSIPTGELGPTLKVKRSFVNDKYSDIIEQFYK